MKVVTDLTTLLSNHGEILRASINALAIPIEGSRFNAIVDSLLSGLNERFVNRWSSAFTDENIADLAFESDRLPLIASALDPSTWVLEQSVSDAIAIRVRAHLKRLFMDELARQDVPPLAEVRDDMEVEGLSSLDCSSFSETQTVYIGSEDDQILTLEDRIEMRKRQLASQRSRRQPQPPQVDAAEQPLPADDPPEWSQFVAMTSARHEFNRIENRALRRFEIFYSDPNHSRQFPTIKRLAFKYCGAPASESSCEKTFSAVTVVVGDYRQSLAPETVEIQSLLKINGPKLAVSGWLR